MMMKKRKIALIGGGQIGLALALMATQRELAGLVIVDLPQHIDAIRGKALDMAAMSPHLGVDADIKATSDYAQIAGSDVIIVTAGVPRKSGMSRDDLLEINMGIIRDVAKKVKRHAPDAFVILATNPVDAMCQLFYEKSGLPKNRVVGLSGALDTGRFKTFLAMETGFSTKDVSCIVMGGHGPTMIPITRTATIGGIPISNLLSAKQIEEIAERTRHAGTEIVKLLRQGSAYISPAASILEMAEAYLNDKKRLIASSTLCEGEFGIQRLFIGVPCVIGAGGVEKVIEMELTKEEKKLLDLNIQSIQENLAKMNL